MTCSSSVSSAQKNTFLLMGNGEWIDLKLSERTEEATGYQSDIKPHVYIDDIPMLFLTSAFPRDGIRADSVAVSPSVYECRSGFSSVLVSIVLKPCCCCSCGHITSLIHAYCLIFWGKHATQRVICSCGNAHSCRKNQRILCCAVMMLGWPS